MKRRTMIEELEQQHQQQRTESDPKIHTVFPNHSGSTSKLSEALFSLSFEDRNAIEEEVHGVSCMAPEETRTFLEESLCKFHQELAEIDHKPAYDRAQELMEGNPPGRPSSYIHERGFKLRFLRCELFDARKAANRYCKFIDVSLELHGETALERPIRMSDLGREEMTMLREGSSQVLPYRDRSGRRIMCGVPNQSTDFPKHALLKGFLYFWASVLGGCDFINNDFDHLETQRKGAIRVLIPSFQHTHDKRGLEGWLRWFIKRVEVNKIVGDIIPLRICAIHVCLPNNSLTKTLVAMFNKRLSNWLPRTKFHFGNPIELRFALQGYGIPTEFIPSTDTGNVKSVNLRQWIRLRGHLERQADSLRATQYSSQIESGASEYDESTASSTSDIVECPGSNDVIFRRGISMNHHPGNVKFLNLIESKIYEHTFDPTTSSFRRIAIEKELIQQLLDEGGRFLKWEIDKCWWVDISSGTDIDTKLDSDIEIQSKVHYAFRNFRKKMLKTQQKPIVHTFERQEGQKRTRYSCDTDSNGDGCLSGCHNLNSG